MGCVSHAPMLRSMDGKGSREASQDRELPALEHRIQNAKREGFGKPGGYWMPLIAQGWDYDTRPAHLDAASQVHVRQKLSMTSRRMPQGWASIGFLTFSQQVKFELRVKFSVRGGVRFQPWVCANRRRSSKI